MTIAADLHRIATLKAKDPVTRAYDYYQRELKAAIILTAEDGDFSISFIGLNGLYDEEVVRELWAFLNREGFEVSGSKYNFTVSWEHINDTDQRT